jgi:hypothetical protein
LQVGKPANIYSTEAMSLPLADKPKPNGAEIVINIFFNIVLLFLLETFNFVVYKILKALF